MSATDHGKEFAMAALRTRVERNKDLQPVDNSRAPAGSPMIFQCRACKGEIVLPENFIVAQKLCSECRALENKGWLPAI
jgi:hypothetical protein